MNKPVLVLTTGGTIEKSYSETDGSLKNRSSVLESRLLFRMRLPHTQVQIKEIMAKDSLLLTPEDRKSIYEEIEKEFRNRQPILVLHGTDTMALTAEYCWQRCPRPPVPVIFTGAMRPLGYEDSDALQNFMEALMACHLAQPHFYISFHNHLFQVPNVEKKPELKTFQTKIPPGEKQPDSNFED